MTQVAMFKLKRRFNLSIDAGEEGLRNLPMYNTYKIDIYKGIDNRFELSIRNNDRKSVSIKEDATVVFSLVSEDKARKYDYVAAPTKPALGLYEVVIPEFDLRSIEIGSYFGHITVKQDGIEEPLYTTQDFYPFADVVVHENKFNTVSQAVTVNGESFVREVVEDPIAGKFYEVFTSEHIKSSKAASHSILVELSEFIGDVIIEQCLREDPDPESWTQLIKREYEIDEDGNKFNGFDIFVFSAVTEYVRVKWKREQGADANLIYAKYRPETMSGGAVASVNGKIGDVVLNGTDIKLLEDEESKTVAESIDNIDVDIDEIKADLDGVKELIPETATKENLLVSKAELDEAIAPLAVKADVEETFKDYAKTVEVDSAIEAALEPFSTTDEVGGLIEDALEPYAKTADMNTAIASAIEPYSTTVQMTEAITDALKPYAKTTDVGTELAKKQDAITDATDLSVGTLTAKTFAPITNVVSLNSDTAKAQTGEFDWYINTTIDYNKFNVWNRYYTASEDGKTEEVTDTAIISAGASPDNHSSWIDFTANYLSFKGVANFGETGVTSHSMNFNGESTFNAPASFMESVSVNGSTGFYNDVTLWKTNDDTSIVPSVRYTVSSGIFDTDYLTVTDSGMGITRVSVDGDSRDTETYGIKTTIPITVNGWDTAKYANNMVKFVGCGMNFTNIAEDKTFLKMQTDGKTFQMDLNGLGYVDGASSQFYVQNGAVFAATDTSGIGLVYTSPSDKQVNMDGNVRLGVTASSKTNEDGSETKTEASSVWVNGAAEFYTSLTCMSGVGAAFQGNVEFWQVKEDGSAYSTAKFTSLTGAFCIENMQVSDPGDSETRLTWDVDSRNTDTYGVHYNLPVEITAEMPAVSDSSTTVPTTAWVKSAIASSTVTLPEAITGKTLELNTLTGQSGTLRFNDSGLTIQDSLGYTYFTVNSAGVLTCATPTAGDNSTRAATTAFVATEIASKVSEPTITYGSADSVRYVIRTESTSTGKLCTVHWHGPAVNGTAITVEVPSAFSNGIVMSAVITPETAGGAGCTASLTGTTLSVSPALTADGNISLVLTIYHEV